MTVIMAIDTFHQQYTSNVECNINVTSLANSCNIVAVSLHREIETKQNLKINK